jgi:hypothetical protein
MNAPAFRMASACAVLLVIAAGGAWLFFSPHLTVYAMVSAARARDAAALNRHINFPALRENLKADFTAKLADTSNHRTDNPLASLGASLASALVAPVVDYLITPESITLMLQGNVPNPHGIGAGTPTKSSDMETEAAMNYEGVNRFVVKVRKKGTGEPPVQLVFTRSGLFSWRLSSVRLPL